ncbi:MAG: AAA family ATPase [Alphaproteobacteria bacterium]
MTKINLRRIKFSNNLSFCEPQEVYFTAEKKYSTDAPNFDLISSKTIGDEKILPVSAFYGANASGKSNFLDVFYKLRNFLNRESRESRVLKAYQPFLLNEKSKEENSFIELDFIINEKRYTFEIHFNKKKIISEKLFEILDKKKKNIYSKVTNLISKTKLISNIAKKEIKDLVKNRKDILILELLNKRGIPFFEEIYKTIKNIASSDAYFKEHPGKTLCNNKKLKEKVENFIKKADVGIVAIKPAKKPASPPSDKTVKINAYLSEISVEEEKKKYLEENKYDYSIDFEHTSVNGGRIPFKHESGGTIRYFSYLISFLPAFLEGGLFIIDELESDLHPFLVQNIIKMFHNKGINQAGAQLIFTTHNTNLMKPDILRRDEIWFVEKDEEGASEIYPLSEFKDVRNNYDFEKGYLRGKFGAIPFLGDIETLAEILKD